MALVKGKFVDKDIHIQSNNDPVDPKDLARKSYVDQKAADEAAAAVAALDLSGKADLVDGKVPSTQLPSYVDDVLEFANLAAFPASGESDKIYVALDSGKTYRWSGSVYIEISASPGTTDEVAEGVNNLYFTDERAQAALASALSGKSDVGHTHVAADITDLSSAVEALGTDQNVPNTLVKRDNTGGFNATQMYFHDQTSPLGNVYGYADYTEMGLYNYDEGRFNILSFNSLNISHPEGRSTVGIGQIELVDGSNQPSIPAGDAYAANKKYVDDAVAAIDLSGKADIGHTHVAADITDFASAAQSALSSQLAGKSDVGHTHVAANITDFSSAASAAAPVQSVAGKIGAVLLDKSDVGLGNVDNTSDMNKPISTAVASALSGKQNSLGTGTTSQYLRGDLTWQAISTSAPMAQIKHVAKSGVDASADGSQEKPYLTIAAAMASITDATPSKRYVIKIAAGAYSEAVSIKANVFLVGESKESVRITGAVSMNADFNQPSGNDCRSGASMLSFLSACDFNWTTVTSPAGKLYFNEVVFGSTLAMYGYNNAIAQAQMNACIVFGNMTVSGINLGVATNNIFYGNVTLNQHPNGGMATIFAATGGSISGTLRLNTTVNDFNRRCSGFLKSCYVENLIIDGVSSYVDCDLDSQGKSSTQKLNGGTLVALTPRINHDLESQMIKPLANNAHNMGDWGKQWFFNFAYVHASAGTDMYILSAMENYDPAGDSAGRSIFINPDGYGLKPNVSGGNIELETAAVSGTGVRGKVQVKARELDMTSSKITNLAAGSASGDAVNKGQLDAAIAAVPAGLSGKKETKTLSAGDITNGYVDCAHLAATDTMILMSGGVVHVEGESYTLSVVGGVTRITFIGDLVDPSPSKLEAGDKVHIQYLK